MESEQDPVTIEAAFKFRASRWGAIVLLLLMAGGTGLALKLANIDNEVKAEMHIGGPLTAPSTGHIQRPKISAHVPDDSVRQFEIQTQDY